MGSAGPVGLQNAVDKRRRREIFATGHQGHPLKRVVDGDSEVIARRHVLAGENDIAERRRIRQLPMRPVFFILDSRDRAGHSERASEIEPQCTIDPTALLPDALLRVEVTACPRIGRS
jgi:hypothetical protein